MNIAEKTVLVTGSNRGVGEALVEEALFAFTVRNGKVTNVREYIDTLVLARGFEMAASPVA